MKDDLDIQQALEEFFALSNIAREIKRILVKGLGQKDIPLPSSEQEYLSTTLTHLGEAREGVALCLRPASVTDQKELRYLVRRILLDWSWLEDVGLTWETEGEIQLLGPQLLAFAHTYVTLGFLPHLRPYQVAVGLSPRPETSPSSVEALGPKAHGEVFPQARPTYADIPVPRTPGEALSRIEELERVVWDAGLRPMGELEPDPLRRTYGFFEAGARLAARHLSLFLANEI